MTINTTSNNRSTLVLVTIQTSRVTTDEMVTHSEITANLRILETTTVVEITVTPDVSTVNQQMVCKVAK